MASEEHNPGTYWRDPALGEPVEIETGGGTMRAFVAGEGEPLLFVHGAMVNANLWRKVVARLSDRFKCVSLDMPLGAHELGMPNADLSPTGLAALIAEAAARLELERPTLIGNDTGGALCQIAATEHPGSFGRLVLTSCDAYESFPPRLFKYVLYPVRWPAISRILFAPMRLRALRNSPAAFGWLTKEPIDDRVSDSYVLPMFDRGNRANDIGRAWSGLDPSYTMEAARKLREFDGPSLIAWSADDKFFPPKHAKRLAGDIPGSRLEWIEGARTFSAEDQPQRLATLIAEFAGEPLPAAHSRAEVA